MYREELKKDFFQMMNMKLREQGWDTVTQFTNSSKIPYSVETVRRGFTDCGYKQLSPDTLAVILRYLNCDRREIREILETYTDDKEIIKLIGEPSGASLSADEEAWLKIYRKLEAGKPGLAAQIVGGSIAMGAELAGVDIKEEVLTVARKGGRKGNK